MLKLTWDGGHVLGRRPGEGRVPHVDQESSLVDDLGAAGRGAEHRAARGRGVVRRHLLLRADHHAPRRRDVLAKQRIQDSSILTSIHRIYGEGTG